MVDGIDDKYKAKINLLSSSCEKLQKENENLAHQILQSKRNIRKARKLRMRLLQKLDEVGDPWRLDLEQIKDGYNDRKMTTTSQQDTSISTTDEYETIRTVNKSGNTVSNNKGKSATVVSSTISRGSESNVTSQKSNS